MLENLIRLANNAKALDADRIFFVIFSDPNFQEFIRVLNLKDQLFEGIDSLGVELDGYSAQTEETFAKGKTYAFEGKSKKKIAGQPIFLFDSGDFYDSFTIEVTTDEIILDADSVKEDGTDLFVEYGEEILGLTDENLQKLIDKVNEKIIPIILQEIFKGV